MSKKRDSQPLKSRYVDGASASKARTASIVGIMNLRRPNGDTPTQLWRDALANDRGAGRRYLSLSEAERLFERKKSDGGDPFVDAMVACGCSKMGRERWMRIAQALRRKKDEALTSV
jgi:hypothetical protein